MGQCTSGELPPAQNHVASEIEQDGTEVPFVNGGVTNHSSVLKLRRRRNSPASWVSTRLRNRKKTNNLSDTFNLLDHCCKSNLVNVNTAPEEELMTLPGINRQLAHNIVEYRTTIGGFRRVEDLALVSGIGASKLQNIKNDVTLKKFPSYSSSRTQSMDSLPSCDDSVKSTQSASVRSIRSSSSRLININTSSIFELMTVRGMTQEMAANIVHYRTKRGNFRSVDQILKVRGINNRILYMLSSHLTCGDNSPSSPIMHDTVSVGSYGGTLFASPKARAPGHRRTQSEPLQAEDTVLSVPTQETEVPNLNHRFSSEFSADLFELLSLRSDRPLLDNVFSGVHNNVPAIRVGSWNMQHLSCEKINNLGVLEVICRTILENGFSILALQDIKNKEVLEKICCELNQGTLRRVREWSGPRGEWHWLLDNESLHRKTTDSEYSSYIYNASHGVSVLSTNLLQVHNNNNSKSTSALLRKPYLAYFQIKGVQMVFVNLHIKRRMSNRATIEEVAETEGEDLEDVFEEPSLKRIESKNSFEVSCLSTYILALKDKLIPERHNVVLGSFALPPNDKAFDILHENSCNNIVSSDTCTDISAEYPNGTLCLDNIWLNAQTNKLFTGSWGVVRNGLSHMAIPRGWGWGGYVSDHCPIYCDLFMQENNNANLNSPLVIQGNPCK